MHGYDEFDVTALADLVRRKQVHPRELVEAAIERVERLNPLLNAVIHRQFERARADAERVDHDAPFAGVPFLFKDYKGREAGESYHAGVPTLRDLDYRPPTDSRFALRARQGGLIPIGRTNVPQLAAMGTTEPTLYGPTHNPWDLSRSPGGSSGGAAAAVAARIVPAAHGNDISGSIRIPAAMCGLVGLKPTRGRVVTSDTDPATGMFAEGVLTRTVRDTAALVDLLTDRSPWWPAPGCSESLAPVVGTDPGVLRIGVWTEAFNGGQTEGVTVDGESVGAATDTARLLESMGHRVEVAAPAEFSSDELWQTARTALGASVAADAASWRGRIGHPLGEADLEPRTWAMVQAGNAMSGVELFELIGRLQDISRRALSWWDDFDVLVTPTTPTAAMPLGDYLANYVSGLGSAFTRPINVTGQPAISLPLGWPSDGLPRGVQLIAAYGRDELLIQVASSLEAASPWSHHRPGIRT